MTWVRYFYLRYYVRWEKKFVKCPCLERLEQIGWLPSANEWVNLRYIRNEFTHDYPHTLEERFNRLQLALTAAEHIVMIFDGLQQKINQRLLHEPD